MKKQLQVVIVDDSPTACKSLAHLLSSSDFVTVKATFNSPKEALDQIKGLRPDVILVDLYMPVIDGFEFVRLVKKQLDIPVIIMSGLYSPLDKDKTASAFKAGALTIIQKPVGFDAKAVQQGKEMVMILKALYEQQGGVAIQKVKQRQTAFQCELIVIGASLGGPLALLEIFRHLPSLFPVPILVVQHLATGFMEGLVSWLQMESKNPIQIAKNGRKPEAGKIYMAPPDLHMTVSREGLIILKDDPAIRGLRPAVSVLLQSILQYYPEKVAAVILTGMGRDGAEEMAALRQAGGYTIAQDEASCVMFGMPKATIELDGADEILALEKIPNRLMEITKWKRVHTS